MPRKLHFIHALIFCLASLFAITAAWAIPPLSSEAKEQVDNATTDLSPAIDTPAFYPLLTDADTWDAKDQSGAMIPDYDAIMAKPRESRGNLYLIEGIFAGIPHDDTPKVKRMIRPGTWEGRLERWTIITNREADKIVIVYMTRPPEKLPDPGTSIRMAGRFYKVWSYQDLNNKPRASLVFVGASPVIGAQTISPIGEFHLSTQAPAIILTLVIISLFILFLLIRKRISKRFSQREPKDFRSREDRDEKEDEFENSGGPLPENPIDALAELERRRAAAKDDDALKK